MNEKKRKQRVTRLRRKKCATDSSNTRDPKQKKGGKKGRIEKRDFNKGCGSAKGLGRAMARGKPGPNTVFKKDGEEKIWWSLNNRRTRAFGKGGISTMARLARFTKAGDVSEETLGGKKRFWGLP